MKSNNPIGATGTAPTKLPAQAVLPAAKPGGAPSTIGQSIATATQSTPMTATTTKAHGDQPMKHDPGSRGFK